MPLDFGLLGGAPRINTPFENLSQILQVRNQQAAAQGLAEERQGRAEERRQKAAQAQQEAQRGAQFNALLTRTDPATGQPVMPTIQEAIPLLGPENATKFFKGLEDLTKARIENRKATREELASVMGAILSAPKPTQPILYAGARQELITNGTMTEKDAPPEYDEGFVKSRLTMAMSPDKIADLNKPIEVTAGASLMSPQGQVIGTAPTVPPKPAALGSFEDYVARYAEQRRLKPEQLSAGDVRVAKAQYDAAGRAPDKPDKPTYEWANVGGENKYLTPDEIRKQGGTKPMTAMESMDERKYKKAEPVLRGIAELSEKINTQQGLLAKMGGGAAKLAAKANYDDDVAEYTALVSGFTPMVARALGHTGVLTQQDVDSVKALFPLPGDSKTLRDRKLARVTGIISDLEGATSGPAKSVTAAPSGRVRVKGPNGETGTMPADSALPPGWTKVGG